MLDRLLKASAAVPEKHLWLEDRINALAREEDREVMFRKIGEVRRRERGADDGVPS